MARSEDGELLLKGDNSHSRVVVRLAEFPTSFDGVDRGQRMVGLVERADDEGDPLFLCGFRH